MWWLIGIVACLLIWATLWKKNLVLSFGILLGVLLAWLASYALEPFITGAKQVPVWLPPLPLATVALVLLVYGSVVWIRGNEGLPRPEQKDSQHHH